MMKKFSVFLLSSWVLVGSSTLLALDAAQASALVRDVQEIKAKVADLAEIKGDVKQLLSRQGGSGASGSASAAAPDAKKRPSQDELASRLYSKLRGGTQAEIDEAIAKLPTLGFDINHSASGGRVADTPLYKAIGLGRANEATQEKLVAAGYRFNAAELAKFKGETSFAGIPFSKAVQDLLAADTGGAAAAGK